MLINWLKWALRSFVASHIILRLIINLIEHSMAIIASRHRAHFSSNDHFIAPVMFIFLMVHLCCIIAQSIFPCRGQKSRCGLSLVIRFFLIYCDSVRFSKFNHWLRDFTFGISFVSVEILLRVRMNSFSYTFLRFAMCVVYNSDHIRLILIMIWYHLEVPLVEIWKAETGYTLRPRVGISIWGFIIKVAWCCSHVELFESLYLLCWLCLSSVFSFFLNVYIGLLLLGVFCHDDLLESVNACGFVGLRNRASLNNIFFISFHCVDFEGRTDDLVSI